MFCAVTMRHVLVYLILAGLMITMDCEKRQGKPGRPRDMKQQRPSTTSTVGPGKIHKCSLYI